MLIEALWTQQLNWCLYWCFRGHDTCMTHIHCTLSLNVTECALKRKVLAAAPAWLDGLALWPLRL